MATATHLPASSLTRVRRGRDARRRRRYAAGLERAVQTARSPAPPSPLTSAVPIQRHEVLAERALLLELACRVREAADAPASALDPVRRLLTDGTSPLYSRGAPRALRSAILEAMLALEHGGSQPA
jgi:hypothetical protein